MKTTKLQFANTCVIDYTQVTRVRFGLQMGAKPGRTNAASHDRYALTLAALPPVLVAQWRDMRE